MSQIFDKKFKMEVVQLAMKSEKTVSHVTRDLGISPKTLHTWIGTAKKTGESPFVGSGNLSPEAKQQREDAKTPQIHLTFENYPVYYHLNCLIITRNKNYTDSNLSDAI